MKETLISTYRNIRTEQQGVAQAIKEQYSPSQITIWRGNWQQHYRRNAQTLIQLEKYKRSYRQRLIDELA